MISTSVTAKSQSLLVGIILFVQIGFLSGSAETNSNISSTGYTFAYETSSDVGLTQLGDEYELESSSYNGRVDNQASIRPEKIKSIEQDEEFILLLKDGEENYEASDFLSEQYRLNPTNCVNFINRIFVKDSYRYAKDVIKAIRFSEIPYLSPWFKELLIKAANIQHLKNYANDVFNLYKEALEAI